MLNLGVFEFLLVMIVWAIPILVLVWFVRAVNDIRTSLRDIAGRLEGIERTERSVRHEPFERDEPFGPDRPA